LAQDERRIASPNGELEFRIFVTQPPESGLSRLAYQVLLRGKLVIDTSLLGLDIHNQEPLLGENAGMIGSRSSNTGGPPTMIAEFMQNGSLGRLVTIEARVWNDAVAFRYMLPRSTPLQDLFVDDEATEFAFPQGVTGDRLELPGVVKQDVGWVAIAESGIKGYAKASLVRREGDVFVTRLAGAFEGHTPWTGPWRIVAIGADRESALRAEAIRELAR